MNRSRFDVPKMDCKAEEQMVRSALEGMPGIARLDFDLGSRRVDVYHSQEAGAIASRLDKIGLGSKLVSSEAVKDEGTARDEGDVKERRVLLILLAINGGMFFVEQAAGWLASSAALLADSLDMLADALIYGIALWAVGRAAIYKVRAAHLSGWLQLALAAGALAEVVRRFIFGSDPEPSYMMVVAFGALLANVACLWLVSGQRQRGAHMRASWIFSSNDVIANAGVIVAGALVAWTHSRVPDLVVGAIIAAVVVSGAVRILRLK